jgi:Helix-turn-helix domain
MLTNAAQTPLLFTRIHNYTGERAEECHRTFLKAVSPRKTPEPAPMRGALKLRDACEYLGGLSIPTMHRLIGRGLIRPNRSLRHLLFPVSELDRFLREGMS